MLNKLQSQSKVYMGAIAFALMAMILPGCTNEQEANVPVEVQPTESVTVDEVNNELQDFVGQSVTVKSLGAATGDPNSFILLDNDMFGGEEVLVFNATGETFLLPTEGETEVQVTGEVRPFVIADVEQEYGLDLNESYYVDYEQQPVVFAESLALAPEADEISENPQLFYNQPIAVEGTVREGASPNTFILNDPALLGGEDLLVVNNAPGVVIEEDEAVTVVGELRPFVVAELERDYNLTWDLEVQRQLETEYQNRPVFVAREIIPNN